MTVKKEAKLKSKVVEPQTVFLPNRDPKELQLSYAGNIVKHLGVQMYAGRPVPAIAELISNAWDADAKEVKIKIPLEEAWDPENKEHYIEISDNGHGMTWEMIRDGYLDVGRDRRKAADSDRSFELDRAVQGRKGVGKLAGFGIADIMEVQTVFKYPDDKLKKLILISFSLSWSDLSKSDSKTPTPVKVSYAGEVANAPEGFRTTQGTTIKLKKLHTRKALNKEQFLRSMDNRFLLNDFLVFVNNEQLNHENINLQWRWPELVDGKPPGWLDDTVEGVGQVKYWIGFSEQPRKQNEGELSEMLIYTRGKISQEATTFEISGGVTGQHGLRYLVGMVKADWLDEGVAEADLIATHRGSIAWESAQGQAFKKWGQDTIKRYLKTWAELRTDLREKEITEVDPEISKRIKKLAPAYRDAARKFIEKFSSIEMEKREFKEIIDWFLGALENATLRSILVKLREAKVTDLQQLDVLLTKMEVRTAVALLQIIESNLAAIDTLEKMHISDAKERGVLSTHIENNPWLIDPTWMLSKAEAGVAKWITDEFALAPKKGKGHDDRADFFCTAVGGTLHIVEIKRGAHVATNKDVLQAKKYRTYILNRFKEATDMKAVRYSYVQSHLIAASIDSDARETMEAFTNQGWATFTTWSDLIARAKVAHKQYQDLLEQKVASGEDYNENLEENPIKTPKKRSAVSEPNKDKNVSPKADKKIEKKKVGKKPVKSSTALGRALSKKKSTKKSVVKKRKK